MYGVYLRVSTKQQRHDAQRAEIQRWINGHGIKADAVRWYQDKETGKHLDRPEFNRLQADVFTGQIKTIVVWRLDRIARRLRDGVAILGEWADNGVRIVVVAQQIDVSGAVGRLLAAVMLGLGEIELESIRQRQRAGIDAARKRGVYRGRQRGATKKRPEYAAALRERGATLADIAATMGVSKATVCRYLAARRRRK